MHLFYQCRRLCIGTLRENAVLADAAEIRTKCTICDQLLCMQKSTDVFLCKYLLCHGRKLLYGPDRISCLRYFAKAVRCVNKWKARLCSGYKVSFNISHINCLLQILSAQKDRDRISLAALRASIAFRVFKVFSELMIGQKGFDIAKLAVADDKEVIFFRQFFQHIFQPRE